MDYCTQSNRADRSHAQAQSALDVFYRLSIAGFNRLLGHSFILYLFVVAYSFDIVHIPANHEKNGAFVAIEAPHILLLPDSHS